MNSKTNPLSRFFQFSLPISLILLLLISGCKQDKENPAASLTPAYEVPLSDNNNDGIPDGWNKGVVTEHIADYEIILDTTTGYNDETSLLIQTNKNIPEGVFGTARRTLGNINQYKGSRLQLSGYIKTEDVSGWTGLWLRIDGVGRDNSLGFDNMQDRAPSGTTDWQRFELVLDVPADVGIRDIYYGFLLFGSGKAWVDNIQFDVVGVDVPVTNRVTAEASEAEEDTAATQQVIFEAVWQVVNDTYVSTDFNGVDWSAIKETYQAQIQDGAADTAPDDPFYELMAEMIAELDDDHSYFLNPEEAIQEDLLYSGEDAFEGVGMLVYVLPEANGLVINFTFPNSGAELAGLQPHDLILAADGQPICCDETGSTLPYEIRGPAGTSVVLTVQTPGEAAREIEVVRGPISGNAPVISKVINGRIGYINIPTMQDLTIGDRGETAWYALNTDGNLTGLILDVRSNGGGQRQVLQQLFELFTDGTVGEFSSRSRSWQFTIQGRDVVGSQTIPLVILIGEQTESYAEVFSGVLQANGRATILGRTTVGNVETVLAYPFADGSLAWIAAETFTPADAPDADWEQTGIIPDIEINQAWHEFASPEDDQALMAAIEQLE